MGNYNLFKSMILLTKLAPISHQEFPGNFPGSREQPDFFPPSRERQNPGKSASLVRALMTWITNYMDRALLLISGYRSFVSLACGSVLASYARGPRFNFLHGMNKNQVPRLAKLQAVETLCLLRPGGICGNQHKAAAELSVGCPTWS